MPQPDGPMIAVTACWGIDTDTFLIAGVLYRDHFKGQDDATVVVARVAAP